MAREIEPKAQPIKIKDHARNSVDDDISNDDDQ